jgi:hypothetical protein
MEARAGHFGKGKGKKLMPWSYGRGEKSGELPGQRRERTFQFWKM